MNYSSGIDVFSIGLGLCFLLQRHQWTQCLLPKAWMEEKKKKFKQRCIGLHESDGSFFPWRSKGRLCNGEVTFSTETQRFFSGLRVFDVLATCLQLDCTSVAGEVHEFGVKDWGDLSLGLFMNQCQQVEQEGSKNVILIFGAQKTSRVLPYYYTTWAKLK